MVVPKSFVVPYVIHQRPPLSETARRAGWVGCDILLSNVAEIGKIFSVREGVVADPKWVHDVFNQTLFLGEKKGAARGWILSVMRCLDRLEGDTFSLDELYAFEPELQTAYPCNHHIREKIRQQLQLLRDPGLLEFLDKGRYRKIGAGTGGIR